MKRNDRKHHQESACKGQPANIHLRLCFHCRYPFVSAVTLALSFHQIKSPVETGLAPSPGLFELRPRKTRQAASLRKDSVARMDVLGFRYDGAGPTLLPQAEEVMQRPHSLAQRMGIRNRSRDISLGEQNRLGDSAPMRQM